MLSHSAISSRAISSVGGSVTGTVTTYSSCCCISSSSSSSSSSLFSGPCCGCEVVPRMYQLTVSGITADGFLGCEGDGDLVNDCPEVNGTWTMILRGDCGWYVSGLFVCAAPPARETWSLYCDATDFILQLECTAGFVDQWKKSKASWDCLGSNTLALFDGSGCCASLPANITVVPV